MPNTRVHYIRHGQSIWNAEQSQMRRAGMLTEAEIKAKGGGDEYTDSPLSRLGVEQALSLRHRLFQVRSMRAHERLVQAPDTIGKRLRCATRGSCAPPRLLTSNLRRAIATLLLALQPALDSRAFATRSVVSMPALQETCSHADCSPMPRAVEGTQLEPLSRPDEELPPHFVAPDDYEQAQLVLQLEAQALSDAAEGTPLAHNSFLREAYRTQLQLAPHARYDDRRRVPSDALGTCGHEPATCIPTEQLARDLEPFMDRLSDVLTAVLCEA